MRNSHVVSSRLLSYPQFSPQISAMDQQPLPTWLFLFPEGTRLSPAKLKVTHGQTIIIGTLKIEVSDIGINFRPAKSLLLVEDFPSFNTTWCPGFKPHQNYCDNYVLV